MTFPIIPSHSASAVAELEPVNHLGMHENSPALINIFQYLTLNEQATFERTCRLFSQSPVDGLKNKMTSLVNSILKPWKPSSKHSSIDFPNSNIIASFKQSDCRAIKKKLFPNFEALLNLIQMKGNNRNGLCLLLQKSIQLKVLNCSDQGSLLKFIAKKWSKDHCLNEQPHVDIFGSLLKASSYNFKNFLELISEELHTKQIFEFAVNQNGLALEFVLESMRTKELCEIAVSQNGLALKFVLESMRTKELCEIAVSQNGLALKFVLESMRTKELCEIAVSQNGRALKFVLESMRTKEFYKILASQNGEDLCYIPKQMRTKKLCKIAINQNNAIGELFLEIAKDRE